MTPEEEQQIARRMLQLMLGAGAGGAAGGPPPGPEFVGPPNPMPGQFVGPPDAGPLPMRFPYPGALEQAQMHQQQRHEGLYDMQQKRQAHENKWGARKINPKSKG